MTSGECSRQALFYFWLQALYNSRALRPPASHDCYLVREKSRPEPRPACPCSTTRSLTNSTGIMSAYSGQPTSVPARVHHTIVIRLEIHNSKSAYILQFYLALQLKSHFRIPVLGIARSQSQFPHSCVCEQFIYSQDQSTYFLQQNRQINHGNR